MLYVRLKHGCFPEHIKQPNGEPYREGDIVEVIKAGTDSAVSPYLYIPSLPSFKAFTLNDAIDGAFPVYVSNTEPFEWRAGDWAKLVNAFVGEIPKPDGTPYKVGDIAEVKAVIKTLEVMLCIPHQYDSYNICAPPKTATISANRFKPWMRPLTEVAYYMSWET
jgi:hypothetical protein